MDKKDDQLKAWIGIDPGMSGAYVLLDELGYTAILDWVDVLTTHFNISIWMGLWNVVGTWMEKVTITPGDSKRSGATFMKHVGEWQAVLQMLGLPYNTVRPSTWMMRRVPAKKSRTDKPSIKYVMDNYPQLVKPASIGGILGPKGGLKDGRTDALCIAEYARERGVL
jgi:hypothetical protein